MEVAQGRREAVLLQRAVFVGGLVVVVVVVQAAGARGRHGSLLLPRLGAAHPHPRPSISTY